ncbi:MAG: hypothetical protein LC797_21795 [Chloroflexi bacterium]|nr:hypothetical protein [Chloroflexota bacterium]
MQQIKRRRFFEVTGFTTAALALFGIGRLGRSLFDQPEPLRFRATLGLPEPPLPSYATYVIEGSLDLASQTGVVTSRVLAGHPGARSEIGLPGLARTVTVTGVDDQATQLTIRGVIEDRSQLQPGENDRVELVIDRARGMVHAPFGQRSVVLALA